MIMEQLANDEAVHARRLHELLRVLLFQDVSGTFEQTHDALRTYIRKDRQIKGCSRKNMSFDNVRQSMLGRDVANRATL